MPDARRFSLGMSASAMVLAALALLGWAIGNDWLTRIVPDSIAMNPMTAVCFLLLGGAVFLDGRNARASRACAAAAALAGGLRLLGYAADLDVGVDRLLFAGRLGGSAMAPNTAFNFILCAGALLLQDGGRAARRAAEAALVAVILNAFVGFVGHVLGAPGLYQPLPYIGMAVNTALGFTLLGLGMLAARPERGLAEIAASPLAGGVVARRVLLPLVLAMVVVGWLRVKGQHSGLYSTEFGAGLMVTASVILLAAVLLRAAAALNRAEEETRRSESRFKMLFDTMTEGFVHCEIILDSAGVARDLRYLEANAGFELQTGLKNSETMGRTTLELFPGAEPIWFERYGKVVASGEPAHFEAQFGPLGKWFEVSAFRTAPGRFAVVFFDSTERRRALEARMRAERLEAANQELEAFSYSVSHDLRAPLRHIDGFIDLLNERSAPALDETGKRYLSTIAESAKRMGTLIDELLAFSRMARSEMRRTKVALGPMVEEALKDLKAEIKDRRVEWKIARLPEVECDPALLRQVFANLLSNALKFTRTQELAVIEVGFQDGEDGMAVVFVKDNGVGFDMEYANKLFGVFQRLHRQEEFEGTGIGLAIVRRVANRHGGEAWAKSEPGRGASFFVSLPLPSKKEAA